jgi:hypothetical protein
MNPFFFWRPGFSAALGTTHLNTGKSFRPTVFERERQRLRKKLWPLHVAPSRCRPERERTRSIPE